MPDPITAPAVERYIESLLPPREPLLAEVEGHARQHRLPIVGAVEGQFLSLLTRLYRPRRILELGCCTGYSALWFADAAPEATIETIELDPQRAEIAAANFARSPHASRITLRRGNALQILPTLTPGTYDLIFNDLLRSGAGETDGVPNQLRFLELSLALLQEGGLLLSDNVLAGGQVAEAAPDRTAAAIAEYNRRLFATPQLVSALVPIRDGVAISLKRS
ncbi:MAG TPA: O-methyltransferase [Chloroflexota bacterium]|jgi:caffeoyl-CoA O-methyltransferase|nr:O-methyltransferase [Chloroflexota bacterium]